MLVPASASSGSATGQGASGIAVTGCVTSSATKPSSNPPALAEPPAYTGWCALMVGKSGDCVMPMTCTPPAGSSAIPYA